MAEKKQDEIKKAVKEALDDKRLDDLGKKLDELGLQMATGFSAVHTRQDTTNGKVLKHTVEIEKLNDRSRTDKWVWLLVTSLVGIVVFFITHK